MQTLYRRKGKDFIPEQLLKDATKITDVLMIVTTSVVQQIVFIV